MVIAHTADCSGTLLQSAVFKCAVKGYNETTERIIEREHAVATVYTQYFKMQFQANSKVITGCAKIKYKSHCAIYALRGEKVNSARGFCRETISDAGANAF